MKYKNRLIVPTLVSTGLLASAIAVSAEEVEHEEQRLQQDTEEYAMDDETSATDLDFIEEGEDEEAPPEDSDEDEEETEDIEEDSEAQDDATVEDESVTETDEDQGTDVEATEGEEAADTEAEEIEDEEQEPESEEADEASVEEAPVEEAAEDETPEADAEQGVAEEEVEAPEVDETVDEEAEDDAAETAETVAEETTSDEEQVTESEEDTEEIVEEVPAETEAEEAAAEDAVDEADDEQEPVSDSVIEEEDAVDVEEAPVEVAGTEDTVLEANEADEEVPEPEEVEEVSSEEDTVQEEAQAEDEPVAETEESTYEYDSDTLQQELEDLSEEERAAFLEENADDIEVDAETMNELTDALAQDYGIEAEAAEVFSVSTMSTMSMSQAIDDINAYIAANNFEVAPIQYDYIEGLPEHGYYSNYGREPGVVGKPEGVVLHDVGNDNSTIHGEINYMSGHWPNAFVHAFVDANNIIQVADTDYLAYGAGPVSNQLHMHVELVRHDNAHDFARSINNYADYIANLLYKYKLPVVSAEDTGEGTLWSHAAVRDHLGETNSPDPHDYFKRFGYEYDDVIELIGERYDDMYNKRTTPSITMPIEQGTTDVLAQVNESNRGLYASVTDVRTSAAGYLVGQTFHVNRTATYNYDDYYLLQNDDEVALGWMHEGDLLISDYVPEPEEEEEDIVEDEPEEEVEDDVDDALDEDSEDTEDEVEDGSDEDSEDTDEEPEDEVEDGSDEDSEGTDEEPEDEIEDGSDEDSEDTDEEPEDEVEDGSDEESEDTDEEPEDEVADGSDEESEDTEEEPEDEVEDGSDEDSEDTDEEPEDEVEDGSDEDSEDTEEESEEEVEDGSDEDSEDTEEEPTDEASDATDDTDAEDESSDAETEGEDQDESEGTADTEISDDGEVYSALEDPETGVRIVSASDELEDKSLVVTVLGTSEAISADHDLYDIQILNEDGSLYSLENPVTVYLPAAGYVSNVYYLGDIGETLEAVDFTTEDGYAVFEVSDFSQYAVVYGDAGADNTTATPVSGEAEDETPDSGNKVIAAGEGSDDHEDESSAVETDTADHPSVDTEEEPVSTAEADEPIEAAGQDGSEKQQESESEMLPDTGVAQQSTTIFATILAALGLGFLVKRRRPTEK